MTEGERRAAYASAFIAQARSDWQAYRVLEQSEVAPCHPLHYLQMVCEKVAKAYRLRDTQAPVDQLVSTHSGFSKFISAFFAAVLKDEYVGKSAQLASLIQFSRRLAREIEKLAPAVDRLSTPENAEYPWERDGHVTAPCEFGF
ncbi:MAG TPA: hypothetical protein VGQ57_20995, partial [Polyangiaceae bacterium]|nr:hypothetical protein [Polyangiaceae bacterium]